MLFIWLYSNAHFLFYIQNNCWFWFNLCFTVELTEFCFILDSFSAAGGTKMLWNAFFVFKGFSIVVVYVISYYLGVILVEVHICLFVLLKL